jgi:hypothetical protein
VTVHRKPKVNTNCVADVYAGPNEKIVEVSIPGGGPAMLLSCRGVDGALIVEPYEMDLDAHVMQPKMRTGEDALLLESTRKVV